jgi:uncharacterized RDD family membrane protein YckC
MIPLFNHRLKITGDFVGLLLAILLFWAYFAYFESSEKQATLGKQALGLMVIDLNGNRLDFTKATIRYFSKLIFGGILLIGYILIGFTEKKQGLHDHDCRNFVLHKINYRFYQLLFLSFADAHKSYKHPIEVLSVISL